MWVFRPPLNAAITTIMIKVTLRLIELAFDFSDSISRESKQKIPKMTRLFFTNVTNNERLSS